MKPCILAFCFALLTNTLVAESPALETVTKQILGSNLSLNESLATSNCVFVGTVSKLDDTFLESLGSKADGGEVAVSKALFGKSDGVTRFTYHTSVSADLPPNSGSSYIFFGQKSTTSSEGSIEVVKFIPATDETIASARKVIAAALAAKAHR